VDRNRISGNAVDQTESMGESRVFIDVDAQLKDEAVLRQITYKAMLKDEPYSKCSGWEAFRQYCE
jgi:hypothetical protein